MPKIMNTSLLGRVLTRLFALFGITLTCVACYGTPYDEYHPDFVARGRVVDNDGKPIEGIVVESEHTWMTTSSNGRFYISGIRECTDAIYFRDGDGEANGGEFAELRKVLPPESGEIDLGDVEMERVE